MPRWAAGSSRFPNAATKKLATPDITTNSTHTTPPLPPLYTHEHMHTHPKNDNNDNGDTDADTGDDDSFTIMIF